MTAGTGASVDQGQWAKGAWRARTMVGAQRIGLVVTLVALVGALVACGAGGTSVISVRDAWARPASVAAAGAGASATPVVAGGDMPGMPGMDGTSSSVVYLTIANSGTGADKVTAA